MRWNLFSKKWLTKRSLFKSSRRKPTQPYLQLELLESRWLMAVDLHLANLSAVTAGAGTGTVTIGSFSYSTGSLADNSATIHWGDGSSSSGTLSGGSGVGTVSGSHTYTEPGAYAIGVSVSGPASPTSPTTATTSILVVGAPLSGSVIMAPQSEGQFTLTAPVATFSDTNSGDVASTFVATIDWGDGEATAGTVQSIGTDAFNVVSYHSYSVQGNYNVAVNVLAASGSQAVFYGTEHVAPAYLGVFVQNITDMSPRGLIARFTGPHLGTPADYTATINWGDGVTSAGEVSGGDGNTDGYAIMGSHTYSSAIYGTPITVTVDGPDGTTATGMTYDNFTNTVSVLPPLSSYITVTVPSISISQGQSYYGTVASFVDNGNSGTYGSFFTAWIDWGDGTGQTGAYMAWEGYGITSTGTHSFDIAGSHTYYTPGNYDIRVEVEGDNSYANLALGEGVASVSDASYQNWTLQGSGTAQQVYIGTGLTNAVVASFAAGDPEALASDYEATIAWGDNSAYTPGIVVAGASGFQVEGSHNYILPGSYAVIATIESPANGISITTESSVAVLDQAPIATGTTLTGSAGTAFTNATVATFTDPDASGSASDFSAMLEWGDGGSIPGVISGSGGVYSVEGTHTYAGPGNYTLRAVIASHGISRAVATSAVTVSPSTVPIGSIHVEAFRISAAEGVPLSSVEVGSFSDANPAHPAAGFAVTITWGDGNTTSGTIGAPVSGVYPIYGSHTFASAGSYPLNIYVNYQNVSYTGASSDSIVANPSWTSVPETETLGLAGGTWGATYYYSAPRASLNNALLGTVLGVNPHEGASDYNVAVYWGDGGRESGTAVVDDGDLKIVGSHTWYWAGNFDALVVVSDNYGNSIQFVCTLIVRDGAAGSLSQPKQSVIYKYGEGTKEWQTAWGDGSPGDRWDGGFWYAFTSYGRVADIGYPVGVIPFGTIPFLPYQYSGESLMDPFGYLDSYYLDNVFEDSYPQFTNYNSYFDNPPLTDQSDHVYVAAGLYSVTDTLNFQAGDSASVSTTESVAKPAVAISRIIPVVNATEGVSTSTLSLANFVVSSPYAEAEDYGATVFWGDGSTTAASVTQQPDGSFTISGSHTYGSAGSFPMDVQISDGSYTWVGNINVQVQTAIPDVAALPIGALVGYSTGTITLGSINVADAEAGDLAPTIKWGDGSSSPGQLVSAGSGVWNVQGSHVYYWPATFTTEIDLPDGSQLQTAQSTATVFAWTLDAQQRTEESGQAGFVDVGPVSVGANDGSFLLSQPFDFDYSPGTEVGGSPALVYNSSTVDVHTIGEVDILSAPTDPVPTSIRLSASFNSTSSPVFATTGHIAGSDYLVAIEADEASQVNSAQDWTAALQISFAGGLIVNAQVSAPEQEVVQDGTVNPDPIGNGWGIDGIDRLSFVSGAVLWISGNGDSRVFKDIGWGNYYSPAGDFGTLVQNSDYSFTYTAPDQRHVYFNQSGLMTGTVDRDGVGINYSYNTQGEVTRVLAPDGNVALFSYLSGLLWVITEPGHRGIAVSHDSFGNLTSIVDAANYPQTFAYDSAHRMTLDQLSPLVTSFLYDSLNGRLAAVNQGVGSVTSIVPAAVRAVGSSVAFYESEELAIVEDARGNYTKYGLDGQGRTQSEEFPDGQTESWLLDFNGLTTVSIDQESNRVTFTYDCSGDPTEIESSTGAVFTTDYYRYDSVFHQVTESLDADSDRTTYSYDSSTGDLLSETDAAGTLAAETTSYTWSHGLLQTETDPDGGTTHYYYDSHRRLTAVLDPLGRWTLMSYDSWGNVLSTEDPRGLVTTTLYDTRNELTSQIDPAGDRVTMLYDAAGFETTSIDPAGKVTTMAFDQRGFQTSSTDPMLASDQTIYDGDGNVVATVDADGNRTTFSYDQDDRLTQTTFANGSQQTMIYDADGNLSVEISATGIRTTYAYDDEGRLVITTTPAGSVSTVYDGDGNVLATVDALGDRTTYLYDSEGRNTTIEDPTGGLTTMVYDGDDNLILTVDPSGHRITYTYDGDNEPLGQSDGSGGTDYYSYDGDGNVTASQDGDGPITYYAYDADNRLTLTTDATGHSTSESYNIDGFLTSSIDANGNVAFGSYLDADDRVTASFDPGWQSTEYYYDPQGNVTAITDIHGKTTSYAYDSLNRPTLTTDPLGDTKRTFYDAAGDVTATEDGLGLITTYAYDAAGRETLVTDPQGDTEATHYDANGNLTSETDGDGHTTSYLFDQSGRQTTVIDALSGRTTTAYDAAGDVTMVTDALGNSTQYQYNQYGQQTAVIDARGAITTTAYDLDGNVLSDSDPLHQVVTSSYDALDRMTSETDAAGHTTQTYYDPTNRPTETVDGRGFTSLTAYSSALWYPFFGISQTDPLGNTVGNGYYSDGEHVDYIDPLARVPGATANGYYDADGRLTTWVDELDRVTQTQYDMDGRMTAQQLGSLWATYTYDNDGRVLTEEGPLVAGASYAYDGAGNVTAETDAEGETTTYLYDALNRVTVEKQPLGDTITTTYDAVGNVLSVEDGDDNLTTYAYNQVNEVTSSTEGAGHVTQWAYDLDGQVTSTTDADGRSIKSSYDGDGNLTSQTWLAADGTTVQDTLSYHYDADENLTLASNNAGTYTMSYDADDRMTFEQEPFGASLTYAYNGMGDVTLQQDSFGGLTSMTYNSDQQLGSIEFSQGGSVPEHLSGLVYYNTNGTLQSILGYDDSGVSTLADVLGVGLDSHGRKASDVVYNGYDGGVVMAQDTFGYASDGGDYDASTQLTSMATSGGPTTTFSYDAAGQLTSSQSSIYGNLTYSYDAAGNSAAAGTTIGAHNQLQTDGTWNYYYDAVGNRTMKINVADSDAWTYFYNDANQLIEVKHYSSSSGGVPTGTVLLDETYTYDVFGNRLSDTLTQSGSTTVTRFAYDSNGNAWADLNSSNQLVTRRLYLNGTDELFSRIDASTGHGYFYLTGLNNTVEDILDANTGYVVDAISYDAYGNILNQTGSSYGDRYGYDGREFDSATGLYYDRARYYDPDTRTWISQDPTGFESGQTNLYEFLGNDPMDGSDPDGTHLVASNDAAGDNVLSFLSKNGIKAVEFPLATTGWFSKSTSWDVYVPAAERDKLEAVGAANGDWGRWLAASIIGPKNATIGSDLTMTEASFSQSETGAILKAQANYRGFDIDTSTPSLASQAGTVLGAAAEGVSDGATIVTDRLTAGYIPGLHDEAERLIKENGGLYQYSALAGDIARESLLAAATGGAVNGALKASGQVVAKLGGNLAKLLIQSCKVQTAAKIVGTANQVAGVYSEVRQISEKSQQALAAYEAGDTYGMVKALSETGLQGLSLGASVKDLANTFNAIRKNGLVGFFKSCFAAGTPLLTPEGSKPIEQFKIGDRILSRDQNDPSGPVEVKIVEEVFVRTGSILELLVEGQTIRTTSEHPFWVIGKGWTEAGALEPGSKLISKNGLPVQVDGISASGRTETVYNLRVQDYHTYFVGGLDWGFSVWAHNECWHESPEAAGATRRRQTPGDATFETQAEAMAEAVKRHGGNADSPIEITSIYGKNPNLRGPNGEPSELVTILDKASNVVSFDHHSSGHLFRDVNQYELPHYHGPKGEHLSYGAN